MLVTLLALAFKKRDFFSEIILNDSEVSRASDEEKEAGSFEDELAVRNSSLPRGGSKEGFRFNDRLPSQRSEVGESGEEQNFTKNGSVERKKISSESEGEVSVYIRKVEEDEPNGLMAQESEDEERTIDLTQRVSDLISINRDLQINTLIENLLTPENDYEEDSIDLTLELGELLAGNRSEDSVLLERLDLSEEQSKAALEILVKSTQSEGLATRALHIAILQLTESDEEFSQLSTELASLDTEEAIPLSVAKRAEDLYLDWTEDGDFYPFWDLSSNEPTLYGDDFADEFLAVVGQENSESLQLILDDINQVRLERDSFATSSEDSLILNLTDEQRLENFSSNIVGEVDGVANFEKGEGGGN